MHAIRQAIRGREWQKEQNLSEKTGITDPETLQAILKTQGIFTSKEEAFTKLLPNRNINLRQFEALESLVDRFKNSSI